MLIEQAFYALPEVLVGSGYAKQEYEASIVSAYSLALLGELNGRNVANPMTSIRAERKFFDAEYTNLRVDLNVSISKMMTGSKALSQMGFRFENWIEAKFFRGKPASTQNLGQIAADIIRLSALVPLETTTDEKMLRNGRYLLHAYLGDPMIFLAPRRKQRDAPDRAWVKALLSPGRHEIDSLELDNESDTFYKFLGRPLRACEVSLSVTNFVIDPPPTTKQPYYTLVLTRIDASSVKFGGREFKFSSDRTYSIDPPKEFSQFRESIATALKEDRSQLTAADEDLESP